MMEAKKAEGEAHARKEEDELLFGAEEEAQEAKKAEEEAQAKKEEEWQFLVSTSAIFAKADSINKGLAEYKRTRAEFLEKQKQAKNYYMKLYMRKVRAKKKEAKSKEVMNAWLAVNAVTDTRHWLGETKEGHAKIAKRKYMKLYMRKIREQMREANANI